MAIDTAAKRAASGGVPVSPLGVNVTPGTLATLLGRAAASWTYLTDAPAPPVGGADPYDRVLLGSPWVPTPPELGGTFG